MSKKILLIDGNPSPFSYTSALAEEYLVGAQNKNFEIQILKIRDLVFDPILHFGYSKKQTMEEDLVKAQELLKWCEHLVIISPVWWYDVPALLKGFLERTFLPGFAFEIPKEGMKRGEHHKLLSGKTATIFPIYGGNTGTEQEKSLYRHDPVGNDLKEGILKFSGFSDIKSFPFYGSLGVYNMKRRQEYLDKMNLNGSISK